MGADTQEQCAQLVEQMINQKPWSDHLMARGALSIAARTIRRGRHLSDREKLANLKRAINLDIDRKMGS